MKTLSESELREMDVCVAILVMKWRSGWEADGKECWYKPEGGFVLKTEWNPTTNRADAMLVLEKCGLKLGKISEHIRLMIMPRKTTIWANGKSVQDKSFCLAICKFALEIFK